jgi:hypothetical protein
MTGSPAVRCPMDSTERSLRRSVAPTGSAAAISAARPANGKMRGPQPCWLVWQHGELLSGLADVAFGSIPSF